MEEKSNAENLKKIPVELKRKLSSVKRRKFESFVPVPDTIFEKARLERQHVASVDPMSIDLTALGEGKGIVMKLKLDRLSDLVSGLTSVDRKGYLSGLLSMNMNISTSSDVSDIKKTRQLYRSVRESKHKDPCGWIAAARLEEMVGKLKEAREIIKKGSVDLEQDKSNKKKVLWKALDQNDKDMRVLLHRAVQVCPLEVQFWIALARSESYEAAKMILNNARVHLPKERAIWVEAAKLEEFRGNVSKVGKIIERGIKLLQKQGLVNFRETWMKEAEKVERAGHVVICQAIIQNSVGVGVEEEDRKRTWLADAEEYMEWFH
ncbi:putative tetratricopeptide-like helical domain, pre-mRNA-processing factor 6/Prp1/STA1 [Rosa chinensis]|uniref:Putative tetratricopeptide-like helical domain, pre-mRNA-processing factor 6/Prp1/STA1 n=1 Tax=Rosa chinensis TaxID=74649 RepID=A0A2P6RH14_ROSCH|nr:putative tetratricopeptide-like helical domain, pre-mRNA-processing factor 6/Prp1/STA1 [Rosa chinensis]